MIIKSDDIYDNINNIKMRYLNYVNWLDSKEIKLNYPADIISAALCHIKFENMNECVNLKNLVSMENIYKK